MSGPTENHFKHYMHEVKAGVACVKQAERIVSDSNEESLVKISFGSMVDGDVYSRITELSINHDEYNMLEEFLAQVRIKRIENQKIVESCCDDLLTKCKKLDCKLVQSV